MCHPVLGARLREVCEAIVERLEGGSDLVTLMSCRIDVQQLVSRMTLLGDLSRRPDGHRRLADLTADILDGAGDEGFPSRELPIQRIGERVPDDPPP